MSKLAEVFDVTPTEVVHTDGSTTIVVPDGDEATDHHYARTKTYEVLQKSSEAMEIAMRIARESENPRAIEVLSGLMKNVSDISKNLVTLNKDKAEATHAKVTKLTQQPQSSGNTTNNIIFTGNSSDLNKLIAAQLSVK